jgi:hypothetical protein
MVAIADAFGGFFGGGGPSEAFLQGQAEIGGSIISPRVPTALAPTSSISGPPTDILAPSVNPPVLAKPTPEKAASKEAAKAENERRRKRRGFAQTILTGPGGVTTQPSLLKTTLG